MINSRPEASLNDSCKRRLYTFLLAVDVLCSTTLAKSSAKRQRADPQVEADGEICSIPFRIDMWKGRYNVPDTCRDAAQKLATLIWDQCIQRLERCFKSV